MKLSDLTSTDASFIENVQPTRKKFDPKQSHAGRIRREAPLEFPFLVDRLFPIEVGVCNATGGVGKTTIVIHLAVQIVLRRPIFGFDVVPTQPKILIVSNEDGEDRWGGRLRDICSAMCLTEAEQQVVDDNIYFEDWSGEDTKLVRPNANNDLELTSLADDLIEAYKGVGISMVVLDPLVSFGPGERFVNDGMQMVVNAARRIFKSLKCFTLLVHHTSKEFAQGGRVDQHSGRGGTALGDGARFEMQIVAYSKRPSGTGGRDRDSVKMPISIGSEMLGENGTAYAIFIHKLTDAKPITKPFWIYRQGYQFTHHENDTQDEVRVAVLNKNLERSDLLVQAVQAFVFDNPQESYSKSQLRDHCNPQISAKFGSPVTNKEIEAAVEMALSKGLIWEAELPKEEKSRGRSKRLHAKDIKWTTPTNQQKTGEK